VEQFNHLRKKYKHLTKTIQFKYNRHKIKYIMILHMVIENVLPITFQVATNRPTDPLIDRLTDRPFLGLFVYNIRTVYCNCTLKRSLFNI